MTNVVAMTCWGAMTGLVRWLLACVLVADVGQRIAALLSRRVWAARWSSVCGLPPVRQQRLDPAVHLRRQSRQHVFQVGPRLVPIELGRLQQAHHDGGSLAGKLAADEEPIFAAKGPGLHERVDNSARSLPRSA